MDAAPFFTGIAMMYPLRVTPMTGSEVVRR